MPARRVFFLIIFLLTCTSGLFRNLFSPSTVLYAEEVSSRRPSGATPGDVLARLAEFNFDVMGVKQGLPHDSVYGFAQDGSGFLWIGTFGGLSRFDGYQLKTYLHDPKNPASLPDNNIRLLLARSNGGLWIATGNAGVISYDPWTDSFHRLPKLPEALRRSHVFCMAGDGTDGLWFGSQLGLVHYDARNQSYQIYGKAAGAGSPADFTLGSVFSVLLDSHGNLWVGGDKGLLLRPAHKTSFQRVLGRNGEKQIGEAPPVWTIFEDHEHRIWIGADTSGLGLYNPTSGRVEGVAGLAGTDSLIGEHTVRGIVEVKPGKFWIATYGNGLITFDSDTGVSARHLRDLTSAAPLSNNFIRGIYMDTQGLVWLGTDRGLSRVNAKAEGLLSIHTSPLQSDGLFGNEVRSVTAENDRIWIGFDKGEFGVIESDGRIRRVRPAPGLNKDQFSQREVLAIKAAGDDEVYAGGLGLFRIDTKRLIYRPVENPLLQKQVINALLVDGDDIWAATYNGLIRYNRVSRQVHLFAHDVSDRASLSDNYVRDLLKASDGRLWITTRLGLDCFDPRTEKFSHIVHNERDPDSLPNDNIQPIVQDSNGRLWIGTIGSGLTVLWDWTKDGKPRFRSLNRQNGFPDDIVLTTMKGMDGRIWCNTPGGLAVINPENLSFETFTAADGLRTTAQNLFSSATLQDGTILFPGDEGLVVVRPEFLKRTIPAAPLVMTEISTPGALITPVAAAYRSSREGIVLRPGRRAFQAEFALLDYGSSGLTRYSYRLEGFDKEWSVMSPEKRSATYTNLPPGNYALRVRAQRAGGRTPTAEIKIPVSIPASWYETYWFFALLLLAGAGAVLMIIRVRTAVLRQSEARLEREVALRTSELLHANEQLAVLATKDALTGILNRRCFLEKAEEEIARIKRFPSTFTLLLIDVDRFKNINDTYGHAAGDAVLLSLAQMLESHSRTTDFVARYGGEEFVVLLTETSLPDGMTFAERLRKIVAEHPMPFRIRQLFVSISVGVAEANGEEDIDQVLQRADEALYKAKSEGRNRVVQARPRNQSPLP